MQLHVTNQRNDRRNEPALFRQGKQAQQSSHWKMMLRSKASPQTLIYQNRLRAQFQREGYRLGLTKIEPRKCHRVGDCARLDDFDPCRQ